MSICDLYSYALINDDNHFLNENTNLIKNILDFILRVHNVNLRFVLLSNY